MKRVRFLIRPSFVCMLAAVSLFSSWGKGVCLLCALLVHEAAHAALCALFHEPVERIELTPFGGVMTYRPGHSPVKGLRGLVVAMAGPAANYACIAAAGTLANQGCAPLLMKEMMEVSLSLFFINLVPALPLDGGSALFSVTYYLFPIVPLARILSAAGLLTGVLLCCLSAYGFLTLGTLNITLPIVGIHLAICSQNSCSQMIAQNAYAVLHEKLANQPQAARLTAYRVDPAAPLIALIDVLGRSKASVFAFTGRMGQIHWVDDQTVCKAILSDSDCTVKEIMDKMVEY